MGAGHSHGHTDDSDPTPGALAARKRANWLLAAVLIPLTLLTLAAMAMLWPSGNKADLKLASPYAAAPGVTFDTGKIQRVVVESCIQGTAQGATPQQGAQPGTGPEGTGPEGTGQELARKAPPSRGATAPSPSPSRTRAATPSKW